MWNIYNFKDQNESNKIFGWVHKILKYKFVVPLINQLGRIIDRNVNYTMKYDNHSKIYFAFDKALNNTQKIWCDEWAAITYDNTPKIMKKHLKKQYTIIANFKKLLFTICKYDTAYDAFFKIFSFEYAKALQSRFKYDKYVPLFGSKKSWDMSYMVVKDGYAFVKGKKYKVVLEEDENGNNETKEDK